MNSRTAVNKGFGMLGKPSNEKKQDALEISP